jgi:hypothetical protein
MSVPPALRAHLPLLLVAAVSVAVVLYLCRELSRAKKALAGECAPVLCAGAAKPPTRPDRAAPSEPTQPAQPAEPPIPEASRPAPAADPGPAADPAADPAAQKPEAPSDPAPCVRARAGTLRRRV